MKMFSLFIAACLSIGCLNAQNVSSKQMEQLKDNALRANEALYRSHHFVEGWLTKCDPVSGLIPRNLQGSSYWNAQDAAADNYPFMVLTTFFTDKDLYKGKMRDMLASEIKLTSRIGACPATYSFKTHDFLEKNPDIGNIIFGSAEYMKDGLLPLTEWLGKSPWNDRMIAILTSLQEITKGEPITEIKGSYYGGMQEIEVNGDLLQILSRMYWMTGNKEYLAWAQRIADMYLLNSKNYIHTAPKLRLRDHGGEIVLGLCELYATLNYADKERKELYQPQLYKILDRILEYGRNEHGMFYDEFSPKKGTIISKGVADTWGYILDGFYTVYLIDKHEPYREATLKILNNLKDNYQYYNWESGSSDGFADAIESAINLYNREPVTSAAEWIDKEIKAMYSKQKDSGIIEGWHGDGNFARTAIMYALWKTKGCYLTHWNKDLLIGSELEGNMLTVLLSSNAKEKWNGRLYFDKPRHKENLHLPMDWTRINQFPEWFTIDKDANYEVTIDGQTRNYSGKRLAKGLRMKLDNGEQKIIQVKICGCPAPNL